jgi:hypothetical protein
VLNLDEKKFQMAFLVQDGLSGLPKDDPYYVEWYAAIFESDGITEKLSQ